MGKKSIRQKQSPNSENLQPSNELKAQSKSIVQINSVLKKKLGEKESCAGNESGEKSHFLATVTTVHVKNDEDNPFMIGQER